MYDLRRICAPQREHSCSPGSLCDLITTTVNLNGKLGYLSSQKKIKIFKDTYHRNHSFIFPMSEWVGLFVAKRQLQTTKWKNTKINYKTAGEVPSHIWPFPRVKTTLCIPCKSTQCLYRWWLSSSLTVDYKLVCCRNKTDRNARKSG